LTKKITFFAPPLQNYILINTLQHKIFLSQKAYSPIFFSNSSSSTDILGASVLSDIIFQSGNVSYPNTLLSKLTYNLL
jgi:hypothetical protein